VKPLMRWYSLYERLLWCIMPILNTIGPFTWEADLDKQFVQVSY